jgi:hypothetical protein
VAAAAGLLTAVSSSHVASSVVRLDAAASANDVAWTLPLAAACAPRVLSCLLQCLTLSPRSPVVMELSTSVAAPVLPRPAALWVDFVLALAVPSWFACVCAWCV